MLVSNGRTLRYRGIAHIRNSRDNSAITRFLETLPTKATCFHNPMDFNIVIADFACSQARDEFEVKFGTRKEKATVMQLAA